MGLRALQSFIYPLLLLISLQPALAKDSTPIVNRELSDLYAKASQQMTLYIQELEKMDERFKSELLRKGYVTKSGYTPIEYIHKNFLKHRQQVTDAFNKHQANASRMGETPQWIDKMRGWADYNTIQAIKYTWFAKMELTKADIAKLYTTADRFSRKQSQALRESEKQLREIHGYDYKKIDKGLETIYKTVADIERNKVKEVKQKYDAIGSDFVQFRKQLAEDTWRWFHYHDDQNFSERARAYKKLVYKSFAYNLDERPEKLVNDFFGGRAFADSDMDFFMNMAGTEDRLTMYIHAAKDLHVFYKLNRYVADKPIELYDQASDLAPIPVSGSVIERLAKLLSYRQKSFYKTRQAIDKKVKDLDRAINKAEPWQKVLTARNNLEQRLTQFINTTQSLVTLQQSIEDAEQELKHAEEQLKQTHKELVRKRIDLENKQNISSAKVVLDFRSNQYRLAKPGESGKDKSKRLQSLDRQIYLLNDQLDMMDSSSPAKKTIYDRKNELVAKKQQLSSLVSEEELALKQSITDLEKQEDANAQALEKSRVALNQLKAKQSPSNRDAVSKNYQEMSKAYARFYDELTQASPQTPLAAASAPAKEQLARPNTTLLGNDLIAQAEHAAGYLREIKSFEPTLRNLANSSYERINFNLGELKRLDLKLAQYAKAVMRHKAQASSAVIYVAIRAGASQDDPLIQSMKALREAVKETDKYLTPSKLAYEKINVSNENQKLLDASNQMVQYFASNTLDANKFDKLQEKIEIAKKATAFVENIAGKGEVFASTINSLRSSDEPNLSNSLSYFVTITEIGKMAADGAPIFGDLFGIYMDFIASSVSTIKSKAESIQERVFQNAEKYIVSVRPENHLYTMNEIKSEMPTINFSDRSRVLRIYQIRRIVALMQAKSFKDVCDRPLGNSIRCN
jgi:hypothetical protein